MKEIKNGKTSKQETYHARITYSDQKRLHIYIHTHVRLMNVCCVPIVFIVEKLILLRARVYAVNEFVYQGYIGTAGVTVTRSVSMSNGTRERKKKEEKSRSTSPRCTFSSDARLLVPPTSKGDVKKTARELPVYEP